MKSLKIHYLDKKEITLKTDCQAIISFYNKSAQNKPSRVRWINFVDFVTGIGVEVHFEHIDRRLNVLADSLSRLTIFCFAGCLTEEENNNLLLLEDALEEIIQAGLVPDQLVNLATTLPSLFDLAKQQKPFDNVSKEVRNKISTSTGMPMVPIWQP